MNLIIANTVLPAAFVLDLILGDPRRLPHPVRWMGRLIEIAEPIYRKMLPGEVLAGGLFAISLILLTWSLTVAAIGLAAWVHPLLEYTLEIVVIFFSIALKSLKTAAMGVKDALAGRDVEGAKRRVAMIVGRDVEKLTARGIARAAVETVAENLIDGFVSPMFFAAIGGAPLAMTYRMINTLDAMVGYKNERYRKFGMVSARLDDAANLIPARLSIPIISIAAEILFRTGARAMSTAGREGRRHSSPNAGYPEAAFAGALGVKLGGPNYYQGVLYPKPTIGVLYGEAEPEHIQAACRLMQLSALLWLVGASSLHFFLDILL